MAQRFGGTGEFECPVLGLGSFGNNIVDKSRDLGLLQMLDFAGRGGCSSLGCARPAKLLKVAKRVIVKFCVAQIGNREADAVLGNIRPASLSLNDNQVGAFRNRYRPVVTSQPSCFETIHLDGPI